MTGGELEGRYESIMWGGEEWLMVTKANTLKHLIWKSLKCILSLCQ